MIDIMENKKTKKILKIVIASVLSLLLVLGIVYSLPIYLGINYVFTLNGPFVMQNVYKFDVMGKTREQILEKYTFNVELTEYDEDGNVETEYIELSEYFYNHIFGGGGELARDDFVRVKFENNIAVDMEAVYYHDGKIKKAEYLKKYSDWFTSYPYLGFIY